MNVKKERRRKREILLEIIIYSKAYVHVAVSDEKENQVIYSIFDLVFHRKKSFDSNKKLLRAGEEKKAKKLFPTFAISSAVVF